jgi:hypothetical protein
LARTLGHFFPDRSRSLSELADPRDPDRIVYPASFVVMTGILMFLTKVGARRQLKYTFDSRAIRFAVIDRRITQGTRGSTGRRWCERIWTVIATCAQQAWSLYRFLVDAVAAHFSGSPAPSLLPQPP